MRCLEHGESSTILSSWDRQTLDVYDRLYGELAGRMRDRLSFLYAGITGDFGEVCYPAGVNHYLFSPPHNHPGFWCGDSMARRSFADYLSKKYGQITKLNESWRTSFASWQDDLAPNLPFTNNSLCRRYDFACWYADSLLKFTDDVCAIVRRHFPKTKIGIPLGLPNESLVVGQIKSRAVKIASKYNMLARWTGVACLGSFGKSNILAKRFSSAARFYGTSFGTEAALTLSKENAANGLYESLANGAEIIHDDPENILRASEIHARLRPRLFVSNPVSGAAVLYPLLNELLEIDNFELKFFLQACDKLRNNFDYEICDHYMIDDGFLEKISDLLVIVPIYVTGRTRERLISFVSNGGRVRFIGQGRLHVINLQGKEQKFSIQTARVENMMDKVTGGGFFQHEQLPLSGTYSDLLCKYGLGYYTIHEKFMSRFVPQDEQIEILSKNSNYTGQD